MDLWGGRQGQDAFYGEEKPKPPEETKPPASDRTDELIREILDDGGKGRQVVVVPPVVREGAPFNPLILVFILALAGGLYWWTQRRKR